MKHSRTKAQLVLPLLISVVSTVAAAGNLQALDDTALSDVRGRDGVSFAVNLAANIGAVVVGVNDSAGNPATLSLNNVVATGTVASTLDATAGTSTTPNYVNMGFPAIAGTNNLQFGFDLLVNANGTSLGTGIQLTDVAFGGTNLQITPYSTGGVAFGLGLNLQIGDLVLQPNGRGVNVGQMDFNKIVIGAAGSNGSAPWVLADINSQPGILNIVTDASGTQNLQWGIGWSTTPGTAPSGSIDIANITFTTPTGNVNLGSSSIGSIQIQYLNVKLKT